MNKRLQINMIHFNFLTFINGSIETWTLTGTIGTVCYLGLLAHERDIRERGRFGFWALDGSLSIETAQLMAWSMASYNL